MNEDLNITVASPANDNITVFASSDPSAAATAIGSAKPAQEPVNKQPSIYGEIPNEPVLAEKDCCSNSFFKDPALQPRGL